MKKWIALILLISIALSLLAACGDAQTPPQTTVTTQQAEAETETEPFVALEIVKDGATDYMIVHDGSIAAKDFAMKLDAMIVAFLGVDMEVAAVQDHTSSGKEILIGNCSPAAEKTANKMTGLFDFAMKVEENNLVLCAKDALSYGFLHEYLKREFFETAERGQFVLTSDNNIVYSQSELMETSYVDYWLEKNAYFPYAEHFAFKVYKNADTTIPYRIYVPFNYDPNKTYPLLLSLHGASARGEDNVQHLTLINQALQNPELDVDEAIILYPQCPENNKWVDTSWAVGSYDFDSIPESNEMQAVLEIMEEVKKTYSVDQSRLYVIGLSMGGYGTWNLLMRYPDMFAGAVPMCSGGDPNKADVIKDIPIWAVHGALDTTVTVEGSRQMAVALKAVGAKDFHYTEIPDANHDVWNYTFSNTEIFQWLFSQQKGR